MERNEFELDLRLDPDQLDVECVRQAEIFFKWSERSVTSRGALDRLKLQLEVAEARLELEIRQDPKGHGIEGERVTEAAIKAALVTHPKRLRLNEELNQARDDNAMLEKAVAGLEMKKRMLENLVTLHGQQYFAGPATPRSLGKLYQRHQENQAAKLNQRQAKVARKIRSVT